LTIKLEQVLRLDAEISIMFLLPDQNKIQNEIFLEHATNIFFGFLTGILAGSWKDCFVGTSSRYYNTYRCSISPRHAARWVRWHDLWSWNAKLIDFTVVCNSQTYGRLHNIEDRRISIK